MEKPTKRRKILMFSATDATADIVMQIPSKHGFLENFNRKLTVFSETNSNFSNFAKTWSSGFQIGDVGTANHHSWYKLYI